MTWLRFSDDWDNKPEIRTLDDAAYRAFMCLIQAAEKFERFGLVTDDYAMGTYPHSDRRKLRNQVRKLADIGLVHLVEHPDDTVSACNSCAARATARTQQNPLATRVPVVAGRTPSVLICIPGFYDFAMTPEQKEKRKQDSGPARVERRRRQNARLSGSGNHGVSGSPVPVPDPVTSTSSSRDAHTGTPSPTAEGVANQPTSEGPRGEYERRHLAAYKKPFRWTETHRAKWQEVEQLAADQPDLYLPALDAFFADTAQQEWGHIPSGLVMHWSRYTSGAQEQLAAEQRQLAAARRELEYRQAKAMAESKPIPRSLAEVEPCYLPDIREQFPGLDLSQIQAQPTSPVKAERREGPPSDDFEAMGDPFHYLLN